jgi:hypothetical protein
MIQEERRSRAGMRRRRSLGAGHGQDEDGMFVGVCTRQGDGRYTLLATEKGLMDDRKKK